MKVSLSWLKELVDYNLTPQELANKLSLISIGVKDITPDYLELDLTYNRGDLLSLRGVAREVAVITSSKVLFSQEVTKFPKLPETPVEIEDEKLSPLQCVAKIDGLKVGPSPKEWVKKLEESGMRSVNNLVDITNLIMVEFGQPLHAFDVNSVKDKTIIVRAAKEGEAITTLDHKLRKLNSQDIVLADTEKPLDVAGVMGGVNTEVKESTYTILLSASMFNSSMVRKTSKKLGLYSEASKRFMHGLTKTNLLQALSAAIKMYESLGGELTAINLVGNLKDNPQNIALRLDYLEKLLGIKISAADAKSLLEKLEFKVAGNKELEVVPPYYRLDIQIEEDVIEEVARMYGYEKIPGDPLQEEKPIKIDQSFYRFLEKIKESCEEAGLTEVSTYSFYSTQILKNMGWDPDNLETLVKIANPISLETQYLKKILWQNLLEVVSKNARKGINDIAIFELGKSYSPKMDYLPDEKYRLAIALVNGSDNPIQELYSILQKITSKLGLELEPGDQNRTPLHSLLFHPNRFQHLNFKGSKIGKIAEVHKRITDRFGIEQRVAIIDLDLKALLSPQ